MAINTVPMRRGLYIDDKTGWTYHRQAAGGGGGGFTSFVEERVPESEHVAYLKFLADQKKAESDALNARYEDANKTFEKNKAEEEKVKKAADAARPKPAVVPTPPNPPIPNPPINPPTYPAQPPLQRPLTPGYVPPSSGV